uniref:Protein-tyrosine phosphatase n=1 Tax=Panagrellus redivivus TaxID=6233 RepID=A0A7E4W4X2_PANRE
MATRRNPNGNRGGRVSNASTHTAPTSSSHGPVIKSPAAKTMRKKRNASAATQNDSVNDDGTQIETLPMEKTTHSAVRSRMKRAERSTDAGGDQYDKQLAAFARETVKTGVQKLVKDFNEARAAMPKNIPKTAFERNPDKNRYKDVLCIDETRVVLRWPETTTNDYIHANWVQVRGEKRYICTQGPTAKTVEDFWRMVVQEKAKGIVMLTEVMELGKKKCEQYWPRINGESLEYAYMTVKNVGVTEVERMILSTRLEITTVSGEKMTCEHILWSGWPDRSVPDNFLATLRLVRKIAPLTPCIVHCSAGIGRTGTIVGLDMAQRAMQAGEAVNMHDIVKELRKYRHGSVQTDIQFVFMHAVLLRLADNRKATTKDTVKPFFDQYNQFVQSRGG